MVDLGRWNGSFRHHPMTVFAHVVYVSVYGNLFSIINLPEFSGRWAFLSTCRRVGMRRGLRKMIDSNVEFRPSIQDWYVESEWINFYVT